MKEVILRQTIPIILNFANGERQKNFVFTLRFSPDAVIIRQVTYASQTDTICDICQVQTNMVDDLYLFTFPVINNTTGPAGTYFVNDLHVEFNLQRKFISNTYQIQVQNSTRALISSAVQGRLAFMMEFVQYIK